ncbi:TetR/AcrR family transcriptional regulator [Cryptosporangium sp. NPDC048952]|uniref:TetR/AcrR family transcriptional regulator n=1 Tax=Cryptosporangium sp. NPDC048952 TaxID=3363961 RepID=UPI0037222E12
MTTSQRAPRRRRDDDRRQQLIEAAAKVISRDGVAAASTRKIAAEAGLPAGLVHYWFADKDELLEAVVTALLGEVEASAGSAEESQDDLEDAIVRRFDRAFDHVVRADDRGRQIAIYELTTWALRAPEREHLATQQYAAYRETAGRLTAPLYQEVGAGLPFSHDTLAQLVSALFDGVTLSWLADPEGTKPEEIFRLMSWLLTNGLAHGALSTENTPKSAS